MINGFSNRRNKKVFTETLAEMVCAKSFDLKNSLALMSRNKNSKVVSKAAAVLYESMLNGCSFSASLKLCPFIQFDCVYISFMRFAERSGSVDKTLLFLRDKCCREEENISRIIQASAYPLFVILLGVFAVMFLYFYSAGSSFEFLNTADFKTDFYSGLLFSSSFLTGFCILAFVVLKKTLGVNKLYEAFLAMGFLVKGGESLSNAVTDAVSILGYESKEGRLFAQAGKKLSYGFELKESFEINSWNNCVRNKLEEAFFYAENSGGENDVFEKIAMWLESQDEKKRSLCLKLLEPFFILGTGIFLMIFLVNLVVPMFSEITLFL